MGAMLQIKLLGRFEWNYEDGRHPLHELPRPATTKSQSLLAYLAFRRPEQHAREQLMAMFWGDRSQRKARRSLSTALWHIRRCIPCEKCIAGDGRAVGFAFPGELWLDTGQFRTLAGRADIKSLQAAADLYGGDFMDGFYDDWIIDERYRLESLLFETLARLMDAYEVAGDHRAALQTAQRLLQMDSLREDAHRAAMRAYCRLGRRHDALAQYERSRAAMRDELDAEPMTETIELHRAIVEGRFEVGPPPLVAYPPPKTPARPGTGRNPLDAVSATPLVGRAQEMAFLAESWQMGRVGDLSLVFISGEAGVGKTRLVQEFTAPLHWQGVRILQGRCYEFERLLPYQPVAEALRSLPPAMAATMAGATSAWVVAQTARLAPDLFSGGPDWSLNPAVTHEADQSRLFEGVARFLAALAAREPALLVFEDLHWATDSTLQLLHYLARRLTDQPLLIVGTLRPEAVSPGHALVTLARRLERDGVARRIQLQRLSAAAVDALIGQLAGDVEAVRPLSRRLYRETEGNPFYLIETIKALFEQGAIRLEQGVWRADFPALSQADLPLPASVEETIQARVERLNHGARDAVHLAAVVGKAFDFDLLDKAWGEGEDATLAALDDLLRQRLIGEGVNESDADYLFTHHKIQEVVYQGLPRRQRQHLHGQVGAALEQLLGHEVGTRTGELAFHFEQARLLDGRLTEKAITYLLQSGQQAVRHSANREAIAYYRRGLSILQSLPETSHRLHHEIELQIALALPMTVVHGYASSETKRVYDQARDLCQKFGEMPALFTSLVGLSRYYGVAGDVQTAVELAEQLFAIAQTAQDSTLLLEGYRAMSGPLFAQGRLEEAQTFLEQGVALYDLTQHERYAYRFGHDSGVTFYGYLSMTLWLLGYPEEAQGHGQNLRNLIQHMVHPSSQAYAHCLLSMISCMGRDVIETRAHAEEAIRLGQLHGLPSWTALATTLRGWALVEQGETTAGLAQLRQGVTAWRGRGSEHFAPFFLGLLAEACLKMRKLKEGVAAIADARVIAQNGGDLYWMAELDRLDGELLKAQGEDGGEMEAHFCQAMETAREQEARMLELRAAISLARLWQSQGQALAAQRMLAELYDRFDEGFDTHDLQAASALLRALS